MSRYRDRRFIRPAYIHESIDSYNSKGELRYRRIISNLKDKYIKEIDFKRHVWKTLFDIDVLTLKTTRSNSGGDEIAVLIWKPTGEYFAFNTDEGRNLRRLHKVLRKAYYKWKMIDWSKSAHHESGNINVISNNNSINIKKESNVNSYKDLVIGDREGRILYRRAGDMEFVDGAGWRKVQWSKNLTVKDREGKVVYRRSSGKEFVAEERNKKS
jgi:hypothetical protein